MLIDSGDTNITPHGRSAGVSVALASPSAFDRMLYGILRVRRPQSELVVSTVRDGLAGWGAGTPPPHHWGCRLRSGPLGWMHGWFQFGHTLATPDSRARTQQRTQHVRFHTLTVLYSTVQNLSHARTRASLSYPRLYRASERGKESWEGKK